MCVTDAKYCVASCWGWEDVDPRVDENESGTAYKSTHTCKKMV